MTVEEYIIKKGFEFRRRGEEAMFNCPFCEDKERKFAVNLITGAFNCLHLNTCGEKGSFVDLQKKLGDTPDKGWKPKEFVNAKKTSYTLPAEVVEPMSDGQAAVLKYLQGRGFHLDTIKAFRIGADANVVKFPYYKNGILTNIKFRDIVDKKRMWQSKDAEPILFNRDNISTNVLIITEGEYDCMALHQYDIESVSVPNGANGLQWVENEWGFLETFKKVVICYDDDLAGREGAMALASRLGLWRCYLCTFPMKDANECLKNGVPRGTMIECLEKAQEMNPETIVMPNFFTGKIQRLFEMGSRLFGTPTAWEDLTKILKGWRGGEVTVWTGKNGSGKSTILNQHFIDMARKGEKTCIYSGEMPPERYLRWAIIQAIENNQPDEALIDVTLDWMSGKIYILNSTDSITPEALLRDFEYAARRYGVKQFIVDSLMKVRLNTNDEYNSQAAFVSQLADFAKAFNCHVHLVAHPRKTMTDRDEPGKVDVKGSSHITDLAHNVIVIFRPDEDAKERALSKGRIPSDAVLYVKKNREFGIEGKVNLFFDDTTKKFTT